MLVTVTLTLGEILERYDWDKFCEIRGINPWCINEGLADSEDEIKLVLMEAREIGVAV